MALKAPPARWLPAAAILWLGLASLGLTRGEARKPARCEGLPSRAAGGHGGSGGRARRSRPTSG